MNEAQVREELRKAVGESDYPAYLSNRIEARLKPATSERTPRLAPPRGHGSWLVGLGRTGSLVATVLLALLTGSLVLGAGLWLMNSRPAPAGQGLVIKQYQAMVLADYVAFENTQGNLVQSGGDWYMGPTSVAPGLHCATIDDAGCPAAVEAAIEALQHWLDDLSLARPPARFSTLDGLMREHLGRLIPDHYSMLAAFKARDSNGFQAALNAGEQDKDLLQFEAGDIVSSSRASIAEYISWVGWGGSQLVGTDLGLCRTTQAAGCAGLLATTRSTVETFQGDIVRELAPDTLAGSDARLQADLVSADVALDAMESALSGGDDVALQAGDDKLQQALIRIQSDVADILKAS
jgi:hypothetical protein